MFLPSSHSFLLIRKPIIEPEFTPPESRLPPSAVREGPVLMGVTPEARNVVTDILKPTTDILQPTDSTHSTDSGKVNSFDSAAQDKSPQADGEQPKVKDRGRRTFLKVAGIAGAGIAGSLLLPKKAEALIMGSSPTTGVVGIKNAANTRINPATEETLDEVLKKTDLTFDTGDLQVKVTSMPAGSSSFSDAGDVDKKGLVDATTRNVQVDVVSSALPTTASTETTLQTISFGGTKFALKMTTAGSVDYIAEAAVGTLEATAAWRAKKVDSTTGILITWADGNANFDNSAIDLTTLTYS